MHAVRGVYDEATVRLLPTEEPPQVNGEIEVEVRFPPQSEAEEAVRVRRAEAARRLLAARDSMPALEVPIWELIDDGRQR